MTNALLSQINDAVEDGLVDDMTEQSSGGSGRGLLPAGEAFVRISMYVEYGVQPLPAYQGKPKAPHLTFKLGAHIVGGGGVNKEGEDEDYVLEEGKFPFISTFETPLFRNEKAKATKWFNALNHNGKFKSMAQALGTAYIVPISIEKSKRDAKKDINIVHWDKMRFAKDPVSRKAYDLPALPPEKFQALVWRAPTIEQWNSLFIDGEWAAKDGKPAESKNKHQNTCLAARDFQGSALQQLLEDSGVDFTMPDLTDDSVDVPTDLDSPPSDDADTSESTPDVPELD